MAVDPISVLTSALIRSSLYAMIAVGFTLIFGVGGILNLAHGATISVGGVAAYFGARVFGFGVPGAVVAAIVVPALFSAALYYGIIRYVRDEPIMVMILTLVSAVAVERLFANLIGTQSISIPSLLDGVVRVGGTQFPTNQVLVFVLSVVILAGLWGLINHTRFGKATMAVSMTDKGASLVGIDSGKINLYTWVVAGVLAGVAGMFLGSYQGVTWNMGREPLVLSFAIVVVGGIGSVRGSIISAYLIGIVETIVVYYMSTRLTGLVPLVVLVLVLLLKPEGLFGRELAES